MIRIAVVLEPCEEGGFSAHVPTLPGCFSEGETLEETLSNIREAIELHLEAVEDDLVVEEGALVKELVWADQEPHSLPDPSEPVTATLRDPSRPRKRRIDTSGGTKSDE